MGPKVEQGEVIPGMRYHVKNHPLMGWSYEEKPLPNVQCTINLLARIVIAKIENERRLVEILRGIPVVQGDPNWRCRTWLVNALEAIKEDGTAVGTARLDWNEIEPLARGYVAEKVKAGRYTVAEEQQLPKPTWSMIEGREMIE